MSQERSPIVSVRKWVRDHWLLLIGTVSVLLPLIFWTARPISSAIFHLYAQDCGSIRSPLGQLGEQGSKAQQAEQCFRQAYQQCHAAFLTYTQMGVDTGVTHTFTTANHFGTCSLADDAESYGLRRVTTHYACHGLLQRPDGLHFLSCDAEGEIIVSGT